MQSASVSSAVMVKVFSFQSSLRPKRRSWSIDREYVRAGRKFAQTGIGGQGSGIGENAGRPRLSILPVSVRARNAVPTLKPWPPIPDPRPPIPVLPPHNRKMLLEVRDLTVELDRPILTGVSFDLEPGSITGVFGE